MSSTIATVVTFSKAIDGRGLEWFAMDKTFLLLGAIAAFLAVALGAFGAHGLRGRLSPEMLAVFQTGVQYHMYHALALLIVSGIMGRMGGWLIQTAGWLFVAGIVLFSGSLYVLAISGITVLGAITPIGGLAFLLGWACLAFAAF
jgi:uncharacterized membrane protein YgdD (TMEM256/DUF423 family)